jgi:hypothetical protein
VTPAKVPDMAAQLQGTFRPPWGFVTAKTIFLTVSSNRNGHPQILAFQEDAQREWSCTDSLVDPNTEGKYICRTAMTWGSTAAHNFAAYSQPELGFATHFNMYPEVQLPSPNGSLGHTRGQVNCAMARSKALINAGMPMYTVYFCLEQKVAHLK